MVLLAATLLRLAEAAGPHSTVWLHLTDTHVTLTHSVPQHKHTHQQQGWPADTPDYAGWHPDTADH